MLAHLYRRRLFVQASADPLRVVSTRRTWRRSARRPLLRIIAMRDEYAAARVHHAAAPGARPRSPAASGTRSPSGSTTWVCSGAQPREVRAQRRVQPAQGADHAVPAAPLGDRRFGNRQQERPQRPHLLRVHLPRLVDDVSRLLLRFGISTPDPARRRRPATEMVHTGHLRRGRPAALPRRRSASTAHAVCRPTGSWRSSRASANTNVDTVPRGCGTRADVLAEQGMTRPEFAAALGSAVLRLDDVEARAVPRAPGTHRRDTRRRASWRSCGQRPAVGRGRCRSSRTAVEAVFDATVLGTHNFVANGIAVTTASSRTPTW